MPADPIVIVTSHNEADSLDRALTALRGAFAQARIVVADDGSRDACPHVALQHGAELVRAPRPIGKGGVATLAAQHVMPRAFDPEPPTFLLCDGDLGDTAGELGLLLESLRAGECDIAIARFARRVGGGVGAALGFSRWATRRLGGIELVAPISGQRALNAEAFALVVPFAPRYGMETAMNIDAARGGLRIREVELPLAHRATGRTLRGFLHRARQLKDFALVYLDRR